LVPGLGDRVRCKGADTELPDEIFGLEPSLQNGMVRLIVAVVQHHIVAGAHESMLLEVAKTAHDLFTLMTEMAILSACEVVKTVPRSSPSLNVIVHSVAFPSDELMT